MTIDFSCEKCGQPYKVPAEAAGKKTKCRKCGESLIVPPPRRDELAPLGNDLGDLLGEAASLESFGGSSDPLKPLPSKWPPPQSKGLQITPLAWAAIGGGGALVLLLLFGVAFAMFTLRRTQTTVAQSQSAAQSSNTLPVHSGSPTTLGRRNNSRSGAAETPHGEVTQGGSISSSGSLPTANTNTPIGRDPDEEPLVPWSAAADPSPAPPTSFELKRDFAYPVNSQVDIVFPTSLSPFMLLHSDVRRKEGLLSVDLRTGETVAQFAGEMNLDEPLAFRADGAFVAGTSELNKQVTVIELANGQRKELRPVKKDRITELAWSGDGRLLTVQDNFEAPILTLWNIETGGSSTITIPKVKNGRYIDDSAIASPGGRFIALLIGQKLNVYETASGRCVGQVVLPFKSEYTSPRCEGICFSPNGAQLTMFLQASSDSYLFCFDFNTGKLLLQRVFGDKLFSQSYKGPGLTCLPGASGWLFQGHVLLDGKSGAPVWTLPQVSSDPRIALGPTKFVMCVRREGPANVVAQHEVTKEELAAAIQLVRSGGRPGDIGLPPLAKTDKSGVKPLPLANTARGWAYAPDVSTFARKPLTRPLRIDGNDGQPSEAIFARAADRMLLVSHLRGNPQTKAEGESVVRSYSVGGTDRADVKLPMKSSLMAVSPDGKFFVSGYPAGRYNTTRLDLWSISPDKHVAGWRPYGEATEALAERVQSVNFIDNEHVLTSSHHDVVLWKLPECRPVYSATSARLLAVSPGGKFIALWNKADNRVGIYDALTGECRGALEMGNPQAGPLVGVFRRDGQAFAAAGPGMLDVWDLQTGALSQQVSLSSTLPSPLEWIDDRYLLAGRGMLVDLTNRAIVWTYHSQGSTPVIGPQDDQFWFIGQDPNQEMPGYYLGALKIPSDAVKAKTAGIKQEDLLILGPGGKASVNVSVGVPGVDTNRISEGLKQRLEANGVTVEPGAPVTVTLSASQSNTGEVMKYERMTGGQREIVDVPVQVITTSLTIADNKGRRWEYKNEFKTRGGYFEQGDVQKNLADNLRSSFEGTAAGSGIPKYVYPQLDSKLDGSRLTLRGELPLSQ